MSLFNHLLKSVVTRHQQKAEELAAKQAAEERRQEEEEANLVWEKPLLCQRLQFVCIDESQVVKKEKKQSVLDNLLKMMRWVSKTWSFVVAWRYFAEVVYIH